MKRYEKIFKDEVAPVNLDEQKLDEAIHTGSFCLILLPAENESASMLSNMASHLPDVQSASVIKYKGSNDDLQLAVEVKFSDAERLIHFAKTQLLKSYPSLA